MSLRFGGFVGPSSRNSLRFVVDGAWRACEREPFESHETLEKQGFLGSEEKI